MSPQRVVLLSPRYSHVTLFSGYPFDSCQLTITWMSIRMSTIKFNYRLYIPWTPTIASNALSLQEHNARLAANQNARTFVAI